jgi:DNA-dependent RNA polymerase auxiliary subunit epsilon
LILPVHFPTSFIVSQNPQVEGVNQHRYIFNSKVPSPARPSYLARYDSNSGSVLLNAGTAHGVTIGAQFAFYPAHGSPFGKPLLTFIVNNSATFFSTLRPAIDPSCQSLPTVFTVFQEKPSPGSTIHLYLSADSNSASLMSVRDDTRRLLHNVEFVNSRDDAHLELTARDNQVVVSVRDRKATIYGFDHKFQTTRHNLASFLEKAGCFYRERDRHTAIDSEVAKNVTLEFYKLGATRSKFEDVPDCQWEASGPDLYSADTIDFIVEEGSVYGVKLTNLSSDDLYPTLFYLDNGDFSIGNVYHFL